MIQKILAQEGVDGGFIRDFSSAFLCAIQRVQSSWKVRLRSRNVTPHNRWLVQFKVIDKSHMIARLPKPIAAPARQPASYSASCLAR